MLILSPLLPDERQERSRKGKGRKSRRNGRILEEKKVGEMWECEWKQ